MENASGETPHTVTLLRDHMNPQHLKWLVLRTDLSLSGAKEFVRCHETEMTKSRGCVILLVVNQETGVITH